MYVKHIVSDVICAKHGKILQNCRYCRVKRICNISVKLPPNDLEIIDQVKKTISFDTHSHASDNTKSERICLIIRSPWHRLCKIFLFVKLTYEMLTVHRQQHSWWYWMKYIPMFLQNYSACNEFTLIIRLSEDSLWWAIKKDPLHDQYFGRKTSMYKQTWFRFYMTTILFTCPENSVCLQWLSILPATQSVYQNCTAYALCNGKVNFTTKHQPSCVTIWNCMVDTIKYTE